MNVWQIVTPLNALTAIVVAVVTAIVGLWQVRRVTRERLDETIDEYAKAAQAKDVRIEELQQSVARQDEKILRMSRRIGQVEGRERYLLQEKVLMERYCNQLRAQLLRAGETVPPRPHVDLVEENE